MDRLLLYRWLDIAKKYQMTDEELKRRNLEVEKEIAELRKANDILKDLLRFVTGKQMGQA
ncbi:hypothetical protein [Ruminococcus sp.]|uniref:hypothetical protein n=1 Tax=Ruminococcus sp. TaxID=41978 RepID=UPI002584FE8D|nr:hypothetical protein [Ruminococcus sp.]MCR5022696.1 hypothetical protein [Ruminococcus sp.]